MTIKVSYSEFYFNEEGIQGQSMGMLDRYFLMRVHPQKIVFDIVGVIWSVFFLWNHNWAAALISTLLAGGLGLYFTRNLIPEVMAQTTLGKIGLLHTHPFNLALNLIGIVPSIYGLWTHSVEMILIGLSIIVLGHFFGWSKVNAKLKIL